MGSISAATKRAGMAIGDDVSPAADRNLAKIEFIVVRTDGRGHSAIEFPFRRIITANRGARAQTWIYTPSESECTPRKYLGAKNCGVDLCQRCSAFVTRGARASKNCPPSLKLRQFDSPYADQWKMPRRKLVAIMRGGKSEPDSFSRFIRQSLSNTSELDFTSVFNQTAGNTNNRFGKN